MGVIDKLKTWLSITLEAKGLTAALCICAIGMAALPWATDSASMIPIALLLLFLGYQIVQLIVVTINENKEERKEEREDRLVQEILKKCSTSKEVQELFGERELRDLGRDIVRKRQTQEYWKFTDDNE